MAKRGRPRSRPDKPVDTSILTDEEKEAIRANAKKRYDAEQHQRAMDAYAEQALAELRVERGDLEGDDDLLQFTIDLAPNAQDIRLDGMVYQHGRTYTITRPVYDTLREIIARTWAHEDQAGNPYKKWYKHTPNPFGAAQNAAVVYQPGGALSQGIRLSPHAPIPAGAPVHQPRPSPE